MNFYSLKLSYIFLLVFTTFTGLSCQSRVASNPVKALPVISSEGKLKEVVPVVSPQVEVNPKVQKTSGVAPVEKDKEAPQSVTQAVERIKISYEKIKELFALKEFEEVSKEAYRMGGYTQFISSNVEKENLSQKELKEVQKLAQELNSHISEVAEFAKQRDEKTAQSHLKHVVWKAFVALRSRVIKRVIEDEKAEMP